MENRIHPRAKLKTWVKVIPPDGHSVIGNIEDISSGGVGVLDNQPLPPGKDCHVIFMLQDNRGEHLLQARCLVTSCTPVSSTHYHLGLQFLDFISSPSDTLHAIDHFLTWQANLSQRE